MPTAAGVMVMPVLVPAAAGVMVMSVLMPASAGVMVMSVLMFMRMFAAMFMLMRMFVLMLMFVFMRMLVLMFAAMRMLVFVFAHGEKASVQYNSCSIIQLHGAKKMRDHSRKCSRPMSRIASTCSSASE